MCLTRHQDTAEHLVFNFLNTLGLTFAPTDEQTLR